MAKLEILFSGLCAFVPRSDSETPAVTVLLVNTASEFCKKLSKPPEPHYPIFKFNLTNLKGGAPAAGVDGLARGLWLLDAENVTFEISGGGAGAPVKTGVTIIRGPGLVKGFAPNVPNKDEASQSFFDWVPKIEDVLPGEGDVSTISLTGVADNGPAVARVELSGGTLSTRKVGAFMGDFVVAEFVPYATDPLAQALATVVAFEVDDLPEDFTVTFSATPFGGTAKRSVTLSPVVDADHHNLVSVEISNLCGGVFIEDIDNVNRVRMVGDRRLSLADEDFESFYIFCKNFNDPPAPGGDSSKPFGDKYTRLPLPTFIKYRLNKDDPNAEAEPTGGDDGGGIDTVRCNVTQFNTHTTT